jgi:hypothetical protein
MAFPYLLSNENGAESNMSKAEYRIQNSEFRIKRKKRESVKVALSLIFWLLASDS